MKTIEELQKELNEVENKINTSIALGEYSPEMPDWREKARKLLNQIKELKESYE